MVSKLLSLFAIAGLLAIPAHATVVTTTVTAGNSNPGTILSAIESSVSGAPSGLVLLGQWNPNGTFTNNVASFTDHVTITPNSDVNKASYSYSGGASDPVLYFIAAQGGSGSDHEHNVYYNSDAGSIVGFPNSYSYIESTLNGGGKLSNFSHIYFYGKLAAVPEPSAIVTAISLLFLGFVTVRARKKSRAAVA